MPRRLASSLLLLAASVLASGCAAETEEEEAASVDDAILGGVVERGHPAVGIFTMGRAIGSGVLIAPDIVLTAAHVAGGKPTTFHYGSPANGKPPTRENLRVVEVASTIIHPCAARRAGDDCPGPKGDPVDVALVKLKTPIRDVEPVPLIDAPMRYFWGLLSPYEDDSCVAVGFGAHYDAAGKVSFAMRRSARVQIDDVKDAELVTVRETGIATGGDSGGPLLCSGRIVGVVRGSAGAVPKDRPFERSREAYERIDLHRAWIREHLR